MPSTELPSTKSANPIPARTSAADGPSRDANSDGGAPGWVSWTRRPEFLAGVSLPPRSGLAFLFLIMVILAVAFVTRAQTGDDFYLLADNSSPKLNITSARAPLEPAPHPAEPERLDLGADGIRDPAPLVP